MALQKDIDFGKLNFAVGFNRTSAFPLDANSYFEDYNEAVAAAASAAEVGSSDSAFYVGQLIIVKDTTNGVGLYQIGADKTLVKFGQASSADELTTALATLKNRFNKLVRDLPVTEGEDGSYTLLEPSESVPFGFFSNEEKVKLADLKDAAEKHISNNDIHVTAAKKTAWDEAVTDVATLKGEENVAGSVKAIAKGYADGKDAAIAEAKAAGTAASTALGEYKISNDARVKAIEDKEATWNGKQDAITDGSAVIATVAEGVVTLKAGVGQNKGAVTQGTGSDITLAKVATTGAAVDIAVADTAEKFVATDLEAVLAELADSIQAGGNNSKVTCEKTSPEGVAARYVFKQGGVAIENATIDIPKDMVVKSGTVVTKTETGAWGEAGTYLELTLANVTNDKVYINVGNLIEYVTSGSAEGDSVQVTVSADHKVTASIKDDSVALGKLATAVQTQINMAHEHANKTVLDEITAEKVAKWDAADTAIGDAVEAGVAALDFTDTPVDGQYVDKVDQVNGVIKPHRVDLPIATAKALGLVKVDNTSIAVNAEGVISVKAISTDKLVQGTEEFIINGGHA